eukprot:897478_1
MSSGILGKRKPNFEDMNDDVPQHKRHKSNHHSPCAPAGYIYRDLEVVWARLEDFPWWPAQCDFTLLEADKGQDRTPRLPVRWFGEDHNRVDWLTRDRIIPFSLDIEPDLTQEIKVADEDMPEYIASLEDAVARQKKWQKDLEKERKQKNIKMNLSSIPPNSKEKKTKGDIPPLIIPPFISHMSMEDAMKLAVHEKIDHRDQVGRVVFATVIEKKGSHLKIHYDGWSRKWDTWS